MPATLESLEPAEEVSETDALEAHINRLLRSPHFARADTQRRLLEYLWHHRNVTLSEYAIATEGLGRGKSFDPAVDASVRVHISRLRRKLKDYYAQEASEPEMLAIPMGTHQLLVVDQPTALPSAPEEAEDAAPAVNYHKRMWVAIAVACIFVLTTAGLGVVSLSQRQAKTNAPQPTEFWVSFLRGNGPIKIILPTPTFFQFTKNLNFRLRSTNVNDFESLRNDPDFAALTKDLGTPRLEQNYTVTSDTLAAIEMARYLDTVGDGKRRVSFDVTRDSSMTVLEQANVIALGTHQTMQPFHQFLQTMNFSLTHDETAVLNAHPAQGEPARYDVVVQSDERMVRPSIIAVLPGRGSGLKILLLQSRDTAAMVAMLSSAAGSNSIRDFLAKNGNPQFYEMVVNTLFEDKHAIRSWPVAVHAYSAPAPSKSM